MTATTGITRDQAISLIDAATTPASLFGRLTGADAQREYRRLVRLVHPDASPAPASTADTSPAGPGSAGTGKLSALWRQREGSSALAAAGDIANLTRLPAHNRIPGGLLKLARDPADGDLIGREAAALRWLAGAGDKDYLPYVPVLAGTRRYADPATGITRRANVLGELTGPRHLPRDQVHAQADRETRPRPAGGIRGRVHPRQPGSAAPRRVATAARVRRPHRAALGTAEVPPVPRCLKRQGRQEAHHGQWDLVDQRV